jgi:hypothetical protein
MSNETEVIANTVEVEVDVAKPTADNEAHAPSAQTEPTKIGYEEADGAVRTLLALLVRPNGSRLELVHQFVGWSDSFQIVNIRDGHRPFVTSIHHKELAPLRDALATFMDRVRERHATRPATSPRGAVLKHPYPRNKPWDDQRRDPGTPRGSVEPKKESP